MHTSLRTSGRAELDGLTGTLPVPSPNEPSKQPTGPSYTLWLFNIAMGNDPFIDGLPGFTYSKWWIFPWRTVK